MNESESRNNLFLTEETAIGQLRWTCIGRFCRSVKLKSNPITIPILLYINKQLEIINRAVVATSYLQQYLPTLWLLPSKFEYTLNTPLKNLPETKNKQNESHGVANRVGVYLCLVYNGYLNSLCFLFSRQTFGYATCHAANCSGVVTSVVTWLLTHDVTHVPMWSLISTFSLSQVELSIIYHI